MNASEKQEILGKFKIWFKDGLIESHKAKASKLLERQQLIVLIT